MRDTGGRLTAAAMSLFAEHGYAATTVDDIADRAGVTQRTFFRHFHDKGEVLFASGADLLDVLVATVDAEPPDEPALAIARRALHALADVVTDDREVHRTRAAVIASEPALRERELLKIEGWALVLADRLVQRGHDAATAALVTGVATAIWSAAWRGWVTDRARTSLHRRLDRAYDTLCDQVSAASAVIA